MQLEERASALSAFLNDGVSVVRRVVAAEIISSIVHAFYDAAGKPGRGRFAPTAAVRALIVEGGALGELAALFAARAMKPVRDACCTSTMPEKICPLRCIGRGDWTEGILSAL